MTKEELNKKVADLNDKIANYTQKICNEIEDLKNAYIAEHCAVKVGDVYYSKSSGDKYIVDGITISDDTFIINYTYENHALIFSKYLDEFLYWYRKDN
mgnify:CR=1 FL=1